MKKTYEAPILAHQGDAVRSTEVTGAAPDQESLRKYNAPGSVGFAL